MNKMELIIPGFSNYYVNTEDNNIYRSDGLKISERINYSDYDHASVQLLLKDDFGNRKTVKKHRMVYMAYNPKDDITGLQINHLDENPLNNDISNLQPCTARENNLWGTRIQRISEANRGRLNNNQSAPVKATVIETGEVEYYESMADAERKLGRRIAISECCHGKFKQSAGHKWEFYCGG